MNKPPYKERYQTTGLKEIHHDALEDERMKPRNPYWFRYMGYLCVSVGIILILVAILVSFIVDTPIM